MRRDVVGLLEVQTIDDLMNAANDHELTGKSDECLNTWVVGSGRSKAPPA